VTVEASCALFVLAACVGEGSVGIKQTVSAVRQVSVPASNSLNQRFELLIVNLEYHDSVMRLSYAQRFVATENSLAQLWSQEF
jgi:hypothetical protein